MKYVNHHEYFTQKSKEVVQESCSALEVDEKNGIGYEFFEKRMKNNEDNRIKNKKSAKKIKMSAR